MTSAPTATRRTDPATLDIIENALRNARHEMDAVLFRTAMSPGIREQHDGFPLIADHKGRMVAGQFGSFIDGFLAGFDGTIEEGDALLTSDPYSCDGAISHANDWLVLMPVFVDRSLVGWTAMFGHMSDVGGKVPGSLPTDARTIYEEGVIIPPVKLYRRGELDESVLEVILNQVRLPQWNRADLNAVVASCRAAAERIQELCARFGTETYQLAIEDLLERNRRAMAELIRRTIPEEPVVFGDFVDDDGCGHGPYRIECRMWREGDRVILDWSGTDPQADGPINFLLNHNVLRMFFGVYMIMAFDPQILFNDGYYPLIDVQIPEGSLLRPRPPAALSCRTHALGRLFDVLGGLLGQCRPEFLCGAGFSTSPHLMYSGRAEGGRWFQLYQIGFGGVPGRPRGDGFDGHSMWPSFTNVPNEFLEAYYPLRIDLCRTVPDSGGPGYNRGGNGLEVAYRFLEPGEISIHDDRWLTRPYGVRGGKPGARSRKTLSRADGTSEVLPSKCDRVVVGRDDVLHYVTTGAGGWGPPHEREVERVAADVRQRLVTPEGARAYGVVLDGQGEVDPTATERLRRSASAPADTVLFDRGETIEELRRDARTITGLSAPEAPVPSRSAPTPERAKTAPQPPRVGAPPPTAVAQRDDPLAQLVRSVTRRVLAHRAEHDLSSRTETR